jgi:site-specific DNA recombinase
MNRRVAIYARVSTPNQAQAQTIEQQLERLQSYVQSQGWVLGEEDVFRDDGYSGATLRRPGLDRLRDLARLEGVERILITAPDRLARSYVHQMVLLDELEGCGCQVEFLDRPMSQDPHDQLLLQIRGAVAEYERTLITERMRRGRLDKYRAGVLLPWTRPPYGYRLDPDAPRDPAGVRIEEGESAIIREIYARYLQEGYSLCQLAKYLQRQGVPTPNDKEIWSLATLRAILTQPAYTGTVYACRYRYRPPRIRRSATHPIGQPQNTAEALLPEDWIFVARVPAIVTEEEFTAAQGRLAQNRTFARRNNKVHQYLLRALVSCGLCLSSCSCRALDQGKHRYYVCSGKAKAIHSRREEKCPSRFAPAQQLDEVVWQDLCAVLANPEHISRALERAHGGHWLPQELQARRDTLRRGHASLGQQLDRLTQAYLMGVIPLAEYQRRRGDLEQRMEALTQQESQLAVQTERREVIAGLVTRVEEFCERVQKSLEHANFEQRRQLVELLIDRVIVTGEEVEIRYVIPTAPQSEQVRFCHLRSDYRYYLREAASGVYLPGGAAGRVYPMYPRLALGA